MTDETEPLKRAGRVPDTGEVCAALLIDPSDFSIVWHSDEFRSFLEPPYDVEGAAGVPYSLAAPLGYSMRYATLQKVAETGLTEYGVDRLFSVEDGLRLYHWAVHRPMPGRLLTLIRCELVGHREHGAGLGTHGDEQPQTGAGAAG